MNSEDMPKPDALLSGVQTLVTVSTFLAGIEFVILTLLFEIGIQQSPTLVFYSVILSSLFSGLVLVVSSVIFVLSVSYHVTRDLSIAFDSEENNADVKKKITKANADVKRSAMLAQRGIVLFFIGVASYPIPLMIMFFLLGDVLGISAILVCIWILAIFFYVGRKQRDAWR